MNGRNLTLGQQRLVRTLTKSRVGQGDSFWTAESGVEIPIAEHAAQPIPATFSDLQVLHNEGLIEFTPFDGGESRRLRLLPAAFDGVAKNFGMSKRDLVLLALYEASGADPGKAVVESEIAAGSGLSGREVQNAMHLLLEAGLARAAVTFVGGGYVIAGDSQSTVRSPPPTPSERESKYHITPRGIAAVEDPPTDAPGAAASTMIQIGNLINQMSGGTVAGAVGSGHTISQTSTEGTAELVRAFEGLASQLAETLATVLEGYHLKEAQEEIEALKTEIQSETPDPVAVKSKLRRIVTAIAAIAGMVSAAGKLFGQ